ncbi:envelope stress response membrane protein PspB [Sphingomonas changnyeongensis]|jgi:phage shock protein B|uniref:Envelope stress response membrane protein PspB n=1 Tax=Sphingomonas changnyeongensis TaxID=2698679 RepID=A0A7Z2NX25_9SPHN|nr:envelope stress response membrane protein PspB [Sphingomonas changnyeongensis]QHL90940.1 envelope stress response membrane protein PspB [Sphingomonas changnyeongensis]
MEDIIVPPLIVGLLFIGLPWLILHYVTQWKKSSGITREDENLLEDLYETARRLDDRLHSIERIVAADNPELGLRPQPQDQLRGDVRKIREM